MTRTRTESHTFLQGKMVGDFYLGSGRTFILRGGRPTIRVRTILVLCLFVVMTQILFLPCPMAQPAVRILCVQSGPLETFNTALYSLAYSLAQEDYLKMLPDQSLQKKECRELWQWMHEKSDGRLQFLENGFYSFEWNSTKAEQITGELQKRLDTEHDVDCILALGTRAGKAVTGLKTDVPMMILGATDPVQSKIVDSVVDSGRDNLIAFVAKGLYQKQVEYFYHIFSFRRLGIVYEDSEIGRNVVALSEIEAASRELGFELVRCYTRQDGPSEMVSDGVASCHRQLLDQGVDAVYITVSVSMNSQEAGKILSPLLDAAIPTFSQDGVDFVKNGALMSFVDTGHEGRAAARALVAFTKGISLGTISQVYQMPIFLAVNLRTAAAIGWNPSLEVLLSIDQFF